MGFHRMKSGCIENTESFFNSNQRKKKIVTGAYVLTKTNGEPIRVGQTTKLQNIWEYLAQKKKHLRRWKFTISRTPSAS